MWHKPSRCVFRFTAYIHHPENDAVGPISCHITWNNVIWQLMGPTASFWLIIRVTAERAASCKGAFWNLSIKTKTLSTLNVNGKQRLKRCALGRLWKTVSDCVDVTCCGRLFQTRAAATGKARSTTVDNRVAYDRWLAMTTRRNVVDVRAWVRLSARLPS